MRSRSCTIEDLEEYEQQLSKYYHSLMSRKSESEGSPRGRSLRARRSWQDLERRARQRKLQEHWHENETSIVIKMLGQCMKEHDESRVVELQRSLLELEKQSDTRSEESSCGSFESPTKRKPKSFTLGLRGKGEEGEFSAPETEYLRKAITQNTKQYDEKVTVALIGNSGAGKTALMNSWLKSSNPLKTEHTVG